MFTFEATPLHPEKLGEGSCTQKRPDPSPSPLAIFLFSSSLPDFEEGMSHSEGESLVRGERKKFLHLGSAGPCARSLLPRGRVAEVGEPLNRRCTKV